MLVAVLGGLLGLYTVWWFRGARHLLLMEPFVAMLWADFAVDVGQRLPARRVLAWSAVAAFLAIGVIGVNSVFKTEAYINKYSDRDIAFIEAMGHDSGGILVGPWAFSLDYCLKHFPVRYSLIPGSDSGLRFLNQKHPISTLALRKGMEDQVLTAGTIASIGLVKEKEMELGGQPFVIFKRPPAVPPSAAR